MKYGDRIVVDPEVMHGKPVIKGTRISVDIILDLLGGEDGTEKVLKQYPDLTTEDVLACQEYGIEQRLNSLPMCQKYYGPLIWQRLRLPKPDGSDLISDFIKSDGRAERHEELLHRLSQVVKNFKGMFDLKLGDNNPTPDESILDRQFEVGTAKYLVDQGYRQIEHVKKSAQKTPEFVCSRQGRTVCVEVKTIRDRDMKDFVPIAPGTGLGFSTSRCRDVRSSCCTCDPRCTYHAIQRMFRTRLTEALKQIDAYVTDHDLTNCGKIVAIWVNSLEYSLSFRNATLENVQIVYEQEFSSRLDCVLVFLDNAIEPIVVEAANLAR